MLLAEHPVHFCWCWSSLTKKMCILSLFYRIKCYPCVISPPLLSFSCAMSSCRMCPLCALQRWKLLIPLVPNFYSIPFYLYFTTTPLIAFSCKLIRRDAYIDPFFGSSWRVCFNSTLSFSHSVHYFAFSSKILLPGARTFSSFSMLMLGTSTYPC